MQSCVCVRGDIWQPLTVEVIFRKSVDDNTMFQVIESPTVEQPQPEKVG